MARLREVSRSEAADDPFAQFIFDIKFGDRDFVTAPGSSTGAPGDMETVVANSSACLEHVVRGLALWTQPERVIPPLLRELCLTRTGWVVGSQFTYSQHCKMLRYVGGTEEQVKAIPSWQVSSTFSELERTVLAYTDCLAGAKGRVPDPVFDKLKSELSDEAIVELTYFCVLYIGYSTMSRAFRVEFDDRDDPIVEVPLPAGTTFEAGVMKIPS